MSVSELDVAFLRLLPDGVREAVESRLVSQTFVFGDVLVREGEQADALYVLVSGRARALKAAEEGGETPLNLLTGGDIFGESALLTGTPRTATVRASGDVHVLRLDRPAFEELVEGDSGIREALHVAVARHRLRDFFREHSELGALPVSALNALLSCTEPIEAPAGEVVVREGDPGGPIYVVEDGRLHATRDGESVHFLRRGDLFGEVAAMRNTPRAATVEAVTPCRLLLVPRDELLRLCDEHPELREALEARLARYDYKHVARVPLDFADELLPAAAGAQAQRAVGPEQLTDATVPAPPAEQVRRRRRFLRSRRFPHVWQVDEMDCGSACLAIVCRAHGRAVSLPRIRQAVHTGVDGASLLAIARGAESLGLQTRTLKASPSALDELPLPAIVHWEGNHWVVLYGVAERYVRVSDPARGRLRIPRDDFLAKWSGYAALPAPTPAFEEAPEERSSLRWVAELARPHRAMLSGAVALALVAAGLQLVVPVLSGVIVDEVVADGDRELLTVIVLAMLGVLLAATAATAVQRFILARVAVHLDRASLDFVAARMLDLPASYFASRRTGDIQRRLSGLREARAIAIEDGVITLTALAQLLVAVGLMLTIDVTLTLVFLGVAPLYGGLMLFASRRLRPMYDSIEEAFGKYQSRQIDAVKGIETVKAMSAERTLRRLMVRQFDELSGRLYRADLTVMLYEGAIVFVTFLSLALFLWIGALQVLAGDLSVGELVSFNALVLLANAPIAVALVTWDEVQTVRVLMGRLDDVLVQEPEQGSDRSHLTPVRTLQGHVRFRRMGFAYPGPEPVPILDSISLDVEPGTTVAIVGRSGTGKTTLVKCLAGLLEPTSGSIQLDSVDLAAIDWRTLRRHVGFVLQESHLFDDTIARNIALADEEPDMDRVVWAARAANAHGFVERLPLGYETRVGESGLALSGGQRQRIAIARALYPGPAILILDEATSALDTESERAVKENMDRLLDGRTSFVIAHRLSTVRDADVIVVLEKGRIVEQGSHDELMAAGGLYYYLCSQQLDL